MIELKELTTKVLKMFDINGVSDLGTALMKNLNNKEKLCQFTEIVENNLTVDWLQQIYQYYQADRKEKKQDYTPLTLAKLVSELSNCESEKTIDMCSGTGTLTIQKWVINPNQEFLLLEIDENVIPYLLFNLVIRNITGYVYQTDILQSETKNIWKLKKGDKFSECTHIESTI